MNQQHPFPYEDIICLSRPRSAAHPPMPVADRAAQFAPFAALTDYHSAIEEMARFTDEKIEPGENAKAILDEKLLLLQQKLPSHPEISLLYFRPDTKKTGGSYIHTTGFLKKIDPYQRRIILQGGLSVSMDDIMDITISEV